MAEGQEEIPVIVTRMDKDELRKWIKDFSANLIYTSAHLRKGDDWGMVFLPIAFGAFSGTPKEALEDVGIVWEYMNKALPRSLNGKPMFTSCHLMHRKDWEIAFAAYEKMRKALEEVDLKDPVDEK